MCQLLLYHKLIISPPPHPLDLLRCSFCEWKHKRCSANMRAASKQILRTMAAKCQENKQQITVETFNSQWISAISCGLILFDNQERIRKERTSKQNMQVSLMPLFGWLPENIKHFILFRLLLRMLPICDVNCHNYEFCKSSKYFLNPMMNGYTCHEILARAVLLFQFIADLKARFFLNFRWQ